MRKIKCNDKWIVVYDWNKKMIVLSVSNMYGLHNEWLQINGYTQVGIL